MKGITLIFCILFLFPSLSMAQQLNSVEGDGRFYSRDDDTLSFIKKQLLSSAFRDVFSKELKEMGLDSDKFWRRYEEKFQEYFTPIKESLEKKYDIGVEGGKPDTVKFQKALRQKRLVLKGRYGRLSRAIPQYSIKKMSRSPQVPNSRYLRLKAKVNRKELHRIYLQFTSDNPERHFSTLYLSTKFQLVDTSWIETGVEVESDFTQVLSNHWREKLEAQLNGKVDRIVFADAGTTAQIEAFTRMNTDARKAMIGNKGAADSEEGRVEEAPDVLGDDFGSSLWMTLNFKIKKVKENTDTEKREFELTGDLLLLDLLNQEILVHDDFPEKMGIYSFNQPKEISSGLANAIFQMPLTRFNKLGEAVLQARDNMKRVVIDVIEYGNLGDINSLMKLIGNNGITKQFSPVIKSFTPNNVKILLEYAGDDADMMAIIRGLENKVLGADRRIVFPSPDTVFQLALKKEGADKEKVSPKPSGAKETTKNQAAPTS
ncbi:MAG: hypothetical protein K9K67_08895 [Bacteriovoracaceae bacterium]|nr:hypothetical protein [Bacteriovoracaceae bacterium]